MDTMEIRRDAIAQLVNDRGTVSFTQLKEEFPNVSEMTLRTDLKYLDEARRILRIHGGAKSVQTVIGPDDLLSRKFVRNISEKQLIAEKARSLLKEDSTFYLDSGSTTTMFARAIPDQSFIIYTTGLSCATVLAELEKPTVMLPGGTLNRFSHSIYGVSTIKELESVYFDQAFMGVTGYNDRTGFACGISDEAVLKQAAMRQAEQVIVLMDSSKLEEKSSFHIADLSEADIIVSDGKLPDAFLRECEKQGVRVI
ncbi:MAG: DeoR/GlpR family DNA-binding transcription regulator [Clostridiales bacterium]|nr:DeoR/GlpR family DNA-binding transcription regulator [Clostridiales bacterium]